IKYGMLNNNDFYEKVKDIVIFPSSNGKATTIPEYLERNKDKTKNTVLYCSDKEGQTAYINICKEQGLEVIYQNTIIDSHFLQFLETKDSNIKYSSVDTSLTDYLVDKEKDKGKEVTEPAENKAAKEKITDIFKKALNNDKLIIKVENLKTGKIPAVIMESETAKRMKTMSMLFSGPKMPAFEDLTLVVNNTSPIIKKIVTMKAQGSNNKKVDALCGYVYDLAIMSQHQLTGDQMQAFLDRAYELLL
ncbi:molecular chaperone HtpG, partial [Candidatus Margulisiibacteriota bacterium]